MRVRCFRGRSSVVEHWLPNLDGKTRHPSNAPEFPGLSLLYPMFRERQETPKGGFIVADRCVLLQVTFPELDVSLQKTRSVRARRGLRKFRKQSEKCLPLPNAQTK